MARTMPPPPSSVTIPTFSAGEQNGTLDVPPTPCFYYGAVSVLWAWYEVDLELLTGYLAALDMKPANLGGKGVVNWSFMTAASLFGAGFPGAPGGSAFEETELNVLAYAAAREKDVPTDLTLRDFIAGGDQSKNLGVYRLHVACDSGVAIAMGRSLYYENKFFTSYQFTSPNLNKPVKDVVEGADRWNIQCFDGESSSSPLIYQAKVDLQGVPWAGVNASEVIDLSYDRKEGRVLGSRRNFLGMHEAAFLTPAESGRVQMAFGEGSDGRSEQGLQMLGDLKRLVGSGSPAAVQKFDSPPCIAEAVPYYMDLK